MKKRRKIKFSRVAGLLFVGLVFIFLIFVGVSSLFYKEEKVGYDLNKFINRDGYMIYDDPGYNSISGIDVSAHQKQIDWQSVSTANVDFAFIRCGYRGGIEGLLHVDKYFDYNMIEAQNNGIDTGVYFYSSAISMEELEEEANFVLELITKHDVEYPVVYDMEVYDAQDGRINHLTKEEKTTFALRFCEIMEANGYESMIYGNLSWLYNHLNFEEIKNENLWYAAYLDKPEMIDHFNIWQYSETGTIPGISTGVDMNLLIEKKEDL